MRLFHPGQIALPLLLVLTGALTMMSRLDIIRFAHYANLWPVVLIAAGLEELYIWAFKGEDQ